MSNSSAIVYLVFEEMAEEESLFLGARQALIAGQRISIDEQQTKILEGIMYSRADMLGCSPEQVRMTFECYFQIDGLRDLPLRMFDDAVQYLTHFVGMN